MSEHGRKLVERLFAGQRNALLAFFRRSTNNPAEAPDLAQEVYLRMLRVRDPESIKNPEGYLFTVAANLVKEQRAQHKRRGIEMDSSAEELQLFLSEASSVESDIDRATRVRRLREVLKQLPLKGQAAIVLQYCHGQTQEEIARRIGVSTRMVKKYVAQGIALCRVRMRRLR
jgi:RNA polymerase sigma factor (sigma-70 family)